MGSLLPELIREARTLAAKRDRLVEIIAHRWTVALSGQRLSAAELEELWGGLAEATVRGLLKDGSRRWAPEAVRQEVAEVIARVRARVEQALTAPRDGEISSP